MAEDYRYKLIKTFWFCARKAGVTKEQASDFVFSLYRKGLSRLTLDELESTVKQFIDTTGAKVYMPKKTIKKRKKGVVLDRFEVASPGQLEKIEILAEAMGLSDSIIFTQLKKMGWVPGTPIGKIAAQKTIEAFKSMAQRGWKPRERLKIRIPRANSIAWN